MHPSLAINSSVYMYMDHSVKGDLLYQIIPTLINL